MIISYSCSYSSNNRYHHGWLIHRFAPTRTLKRMLPSAPFERSSWEIVDDMQLFQHNISSLPTGGKVAVNPGDLILRIDRRTFLFLFHSLLEYPCSPACYGPTLFNFGNTNCIMYCRGIPQTSENQSNHLRSPPSYKTPSHARKIASPARFTVQNSRRVIARSYHVQNRAGVLGGIETVA